MFISSSALLIRALSLSENHIVYLDGAAERRPLSAPTRCFSQRLNPVDKIGQVSVWPLTSMRSNRPNGRIVGGLEKVCPDGQRACLGCRHCLHTRGCLSVGGQRGGLWCDKLGVGGAQLARPRMEHRTSRHSLADLVGFTARKHSCPVAHVVRSAPPSAGGSRSTQNSAAANLFFLVVVLGLRLLLLLHRRRGVR